MSEFSERIAQLSPKRLALLAMDLQAKLEAMAQARTEPIAIIGMGCRFPGGASSPEAFWRLLHDGVDAISEVPPDRWAVDAYYDPDPNAPGKMSTRWGGFVERADLFDAEFFGIAPREAASMDPQQRLLLEVSWEALEHAGQAPEHFENSRTGVFVGIANSEYGQLLTGDPTRYDAYSGSGSTPSIASGRLSYVLRLHGASLSIDTACSSSLVAVHLACLSLRAGECRMTLAGGVNRIILPDSTILMSKLQVLADDGRCKTFDASANGYVRGEGCGIVVLKRLSDAIADGDTILALIAGSAVNHDGRSSGLTAPNRLAQEAVMRDALAASGIAPSEVGYVEAHGTGTVLGDPIEVGALGTVFGARGGAPRLLVGSVKTNIGHLEAAAGIAGLIKTVLCVQHGEVVPHLHFHQPNPYIPWAELPIEIPTTLTPWPISGGRRIGAVSSFGFSGTNAHVIVMEAPEQKRAEAQVERPYHLLCLSARSDNALREQASRLQHYVQEHPEVELPDICFTANTTRAHFSHRLALVAESPTLVQETLQAFTSGSTIAGAQYRHLQPNDQPEVVFLFTGQGSQYVDMGRQLYETQPTFRAALDTCAELLRPYLDRPLLSVLHPNPGVDSPLDQTAYTQPALFALEYSLAMLWRSWGVKPAAVMGHSVGEYVAACVAEVFSLADALKLIAERGRLMQALPQNGSMATVFADETRVAATLAPYASDVSIAAINGPENVVISGATKALLEVLKLLRVAGIKSHPLNVSHGFHSPLMVPILDAFEETAASVHFSAPEIGLVSNVTGQLATAEMMSQRAYWRRHIRDAVRFSSGVETLHQQGYRIWLEIGPNPVLSGLGNRCIPEGVWLPSLRQGRNEWKQMLLTLGTLYAYGVGIDWAAFDRDYPRRKVALPTYPFQRQSYWVETTAGGRQRAEVKPTWVTSPLVQLLEQGNTTELAQQLATAEAFSEAEEQILPRVLEVLLRRHRDALEAAAIQECLYELQWQVQPRSLPSDGADLRSAGAGVWLLMADRGGVGHALATLLEERGQRFILVEPGATFEQISVNRWRLNPVLPEDYRRLLAEIHVSEAAPLRGVVHLWNMDTVAPRGLTGETLAALQELGCGSVLYVVQALAQMPWSVTPRLWVVTRGASPADRVAEPLALGQAPVWGLGRTVAQECPEIWGGLIDLAPEAEAKAAQQLLAELREPDQEDQIAWRAGQRYVARLVRSAPPKAAPQIQLSDEGTFLITGGLGSLGLQVAEWLVAHGVCHLVLMGRHGAATEVAQATVRRWQEAGVEVCVAQADVAQVDDLHRVLTEIPDSMPPLRGVIHAAGILDDGILMQQQWARFAAVLAPKVAGAWNLHLLTQELKLDYFVLFSSAASVLGATGQGNYAAANAFLDALAHYRRTQGLPGMSINWGPWAEMGMAATDRIGVRLAAQGIEALTPARGLAALGQLLRHPVAQIGVLPIDWPKFLRSIPTGQTPPFLRDVARGRPSDAATSPASMQRTDIVEQLEQAASSARWELLLAYLQKEVSQVLGFATAQPLEPQQGFFDLGMDSLMAVELKNRLQRSLGSPLPTPIAFDYPSVEALGRYLVKAVLPCELFSGSAEESPQEEDERAQFAAALANLAPDEIAGLLAQELAAIDRDKVE